MQNLIKALLANLTADASSKVDFPIYYYIFLVVLQHAKTYIHTYSLLASSHLEMPKRPVEINTFVIRFAERNEMEEEASTTTAKERKKSNFLYK
jgi:hypothetical protein